MDAAEIQRLKTVESPRQREDRWAQWMKVMTPVAQDNLKRLNAAGKDIVALGTDRSAGADVHRELELLVGGGITPADAIVIATRNSARFLGLLDEIGTIEVGQDRRSGAAERRSDDGHQPREADRGGRPERCRRGSGDAGLAREPQVSPLHHRMTARVRAS